MAGTRKTTIGILAHVDAGKTTLAEAMLFCAGAIRKQGRVDHGSTQLDTHILERERGITIFSAQAELSVSGLDITLLDTPGHVDFSAEMERTLQVLDYAILVISGSDGVQAHTRTLWKLLSYYNVPTFVFTTKMDFARKTEEEIINNLSEEFHETFIRMTDSLSDEDKENIAMQSETLMNAFLETGDISDSDIAEHIRMRNVFPVYFGSGLKLEGIEYFLEGLSKYTTAKDYPDAFGAKIFKISHDNQGNRITHLKITGGKLKARDTVKYADIEEKIGQIRIYSGTKFTQVDEADAGCVCAVTGLTQTKNGMGLGIEASSGSPVLEPVMNYRITFPNGEDPKTMMPKLRTLEEEDPMLEVSWNSHRQEINVGLMGQVQIEILKSIILQRFGVDSVIDNGRVLYKETIENTVEGVGHYEPLRHYSEAHFLLEPLRRGGGLQFATRCSENDLDRNWQRLILTHLTEKTHLGVLTGSPITDMKITLMAGRAHLKHTEGGDFRQATYRGVRMGLMNAKSVLLEPYCKFRLEVPSEQIGRAINDIRMRFGEPGNPETMGNVTVISGRAPVTTMNDYPTEIMAYTGGRGKISFDSDGYDVCHNPDEVIRDMEYDPEGDLENSPDSVFCAHGAGFPVKWYDVPKYMHLESVIKKETELKPVTVRQRAMSIDDKELEAIMTREFGPIRRREYSAPKTENVRDYDSTYSANAKVKCIVVDGYNVIFAWDELKALAESDLSLARSALMNILCNYGAYLNTEIVLVFDAYRQSGNMGKNFDYHNIHVVYTKENETGDLYIEKFVSHIGKNEQVRVVTSDNLIRVAAMRSGVIRVTSQNFEKEVKGVLGEISKKLNKTDRTRLSDIAKIIYFEENGDNKNLKNTKG